MLYDQGQLASIYSTAYQVERIGNLRIRFLLASSPGSLIISMCTRGQCMDMQCCNAGNKANACVVVCDCVLFLSRLLRTSSLLKCWGTFFCMFHEISVTRYYNKIYYNLCDSTAGRTTDIQCGRLFTLAKVIYNFCFFFRMVVSTLLRMQIPSQLPALSTRRRGHSVSGPRRR